MSLREELEVVLKKYIRQFEKKHDVELQYAVDDDIMGVLDFGDAYFFNMCDVVYDIDNKLPKELILQWAEDSIDEEKNPAYKRISLKSYAKGLRFEELPENKRKRAKGKKQ